MRPRPDETELVGHWIVREGQATADETCDRIRALTSGALNELAVDSSGWYRLFCDPVDGRLWELSYPYGSMHGGGPPALAVIPLAEAVERYRTDLA